MVKFATHLIVLFLEIADHDACFFTFCAQLRLQVGQLVLYPFVFQKQLFRRLVHSWESLRRLTALQLIGEFCDLLT